MSGANPEIEFVQTEEFTTESQRHREEAGEDQSKDAPRKKRKRRPERARETGKARKTGKSRKYRNGPEIFSTDAVWCTRNRAIPGVLFPAPNLAN